MKDALIFIDTNIFLDFYRITGRDTKLSILSLIDDNQGRIITGEQVEMEYKKNRQGRILEAMRSLKQNGPSHLQPPAFLKEAQPSRMIAKNIEQIKKQTGRIEKRLERALSDPAQYDPIYQCLQRLFRADCDYHLTSSKGTWKQMWSSAQRRFLRGYPPRKSADTSCGDAVNWEWIVHCAAESKRNIVLVSRDQDYGQVLDDRPVLNDWLQTEFKERTGKKRKIVLTNRLTSAFQIVSIKATKEQISEEQSIPPDHADPTDEGAVRQEFDYSGVFAKVQLQREVLQAQAKCSALFVKIARLKQAIEECETSSKRNP